MPSLYFFDDTAWESRALQQVALQRSTWNNLGQIATPQLHAQTRLLSRTYPDMPSGIISAAAQAGVGPDEPALLNLAEDYTKDQESGWNFMKTLTMPFQAGFGVGKGVLRGAMTAFDMLWEEVIARPTRTTVGAYQGMGLQEAYTMAGSSYGVRAIDQWLKDPLGNTFDWLLPGDQVAPEDRVNLGSGFLPGSNLATEENAANDPQVTALLQKGYSLEAAVAEANQQYGTPIVQESRADAERIQIHKNGKSSAVSPGRLLAISVFEPGTAEFNIVSGIADAAAQMYLDPADKLLKGFRLAKMARNTIIPDGVRKTTTLKGATFGKLSPTMNEFIDSDLGADLTNFGAANTDFAKTLSIFGKNVQGAGQVKWLKALNDTTDPTEWKSIFRSAYENPSQGLYATAAPVSMGVTRRTRRGVMSQLSGQALGGELGKLGGAKVAIKHNLQGGRMYRLFSEMGGNAVPVGDLARSIDEAEKFMSSAGFSAEESSEFLYRFASANENNYEEIGAIVKDMIGSFGDRLAAEGVPSPVVTYMKDVYKTVEGMRAYFINAAGNPAWFPGSATKIMDDGTEIALPSAHLMSEFLNRAVPLPDPRQVRKALRGAQSSRAMQMVFRVSDSADLQEGAITKLADVYMQKVWKPMTLIRVAWPVRVIGEEQIRMVGANLDSVFRHPMQYFGWALHDQTRMGQIFKGMVRGETDLLGNPLEEAMEYQKAMSTYASFGLDPVRAPGPQEFHSVAFGDPRYFVGWSREIVQLANDPVAKLVAQAGIDDIDSPGAVSAMQALKDRFFEGDLNQYRMRFINDSGNWELLHNRTWSDGYIDSIYARITDKTGGKFNYYDTDGIWYDGLSSKPLARGDIPAGGVNDQYNELLEFTSIDLSTIDLDPSVAHTISGQLEKYVHQMSADDPMNDLVQEAWELWGEFDDAVQFGSVSDMENFLSEFQFVVNKYLDEAQVVPQLDSAGREIIRLNEAQALHEFATASGAGRNPLGQALESIGPIKKGNPMLQAHPTPDGVATPIYGLNPNQPEAIVMSHNGLETMSVRIEWDGDRVVELHIGSAEMPENGSMTWNSGHDLARVGRELERLDIIGTEDILDMIMGGVPVRQWLLTSPALRVLDPDDVAKMPIGDLVRTIANEAGDANFTVADVAESIKNVAKAMPRTDLAENHRTGVMFAQALRNQLGDEWTEFVDEFMYELSLSIPTNDMTINEFYHWNPHAEAMADRVGELLPEGSTIKPEQALFDAVFTEVTKDPEAYIERVIDGGGEVDSISKEFLRSQMPMFPAPGGYPVSQDGANAMATVARKFTEPKHTKKIPQGRPQYHVTESGDVELMRAIATGDLNGINLRNLSSTSDAKKLSAALNSQYGHRAPAHVKVSKELEPTEMAMWDKAITVMFSEFMSKPTNQLSRSPAFRQFYWKRMARMMPWMDEATQKEIIQRAADAGVEERFIKNELRNFARRATGREGISQAEAELNRLAEVPIAGLSGSMSLLEADGSVSMKDFAAMDQVAKAFALQETQSLLYDITRKHDIADMTRNMFPFAEAWGEILSSWGKIMVDNPRMLRRGQQVVEGARGAGWFYEDPATGEEVFNYPGSGLVTDWMMSDNAGAKLAGGAIAGGVGGALLGGIPGAIGGGLAGSGAAVAASGLTSDTEGPSSVQFTGRVEGLNLIAGSYLPGFGPIVQLGMSNLLSEQMADPDWRWVRDLVLPFGGQEVDSPGQAIIDTALPAWFRKGLTSLARGDGENTRMYANTVMDVYKALLTGSGSDATPEDAEITLRRAKDIAKNIYRIRAIAQFAAPSGPGVRFDIEDKNGDVWTYINLAQEWARMQKENDYDEVATFTQFTERFGLDPTLFSTAKTTSVVKRATTEEGVDWEYENQDLYAPSSPYYTTAYFAKPDDPFAEYDYGAYLKQLEDKTRQGLTPEQWVTERNDFLGRIGYERARRMVGGRTDDAARGWLRQIRGQLEAQYEGYNAPTIGIAKRAERSQLMDSFKRWGETDVLRATEAGQGITRYMEARNAALAQAAQLGITESGFGSAKSTRYLRNWLRDIGRYLTTIYPDFGVAYDQVLRREVEDDEAQTSILGGQQA